MGAYCLRGNTTDWDITDLSCILSGGTYGAAYEIPLVAHSEICGIETPSPGRCSRFVIEGLGKLVVAKVVITAFVSPGLTLLASFPALVRAKESLVQYALRRPDYSDKKSLDVELAGIIMLMDLCLIFGFAVPLVLPLLCVAFAAHMAVFHLAASRLQQKVKYDCKPAGKYLFVSAIIGNGLNLWFFIDNADQIVGQTLVYIGIPVGICVGLSMAFAWRHMTMGETSIDIELEQALTDDKLHCGTYVPPDPIYGGGAAPGAGVAAVSAR